ncbi:NACHT domain-containing protein [Mycena indigotica]|uniref:NACHT domain-containing protein n=1 Tax=Mycena indigotica TaxID=2126181 RepID=A0A8H6SQB7_9AGAR|nr:NACHT domain-containing protein [Mycena indigotica]KAF7303853.1 NACHT domain-containing protein [Mycena indigotica]
MILPITPMQYNGFDGLFLLHSAIVIGAAHDSVERQPSPRCHPQTRKVVFEIILAWTKNAQRGPRVMWVHGEGGSGKTAISQTVAEYCAHTGQLGASFFFSYNKGDLSDGRKLFLTLAYKLAHAIPALRIPISRAIQYDTTILSDSPEVQAEKLIIEPFQTTHHPPVPTLVLIDGLDACEGDDMQQRILAIIAQLVVVHKLPLFFFITSRVSTTIQTAFDSTMVRKVSTTIPLDVFTSDEEVRTFLRSEFASIRHYHAPVMTTIPEPWPSTDVVELLVNKSGGQFLYPSTVVKYVNDPRGNPAERLVEVVVAAAGQSNLSPTDHLYHHILSNGVGLVGDPSSVLHVLGPLACLYAALPPNDLALLLGISPGEISEVLGNAATIEFLTDLNRAGHFWVDLGVHHAELASGCIRYIDQHLDGLEGINLALYQYTRRRWTKHLDNAIPTVALLEQLSNPRFVYSRVLPEIEIVISWLQRIPDISGDLLYLWQRWATEQLLQQSPLSSVRSFSP